MADFVIARKQTSAVEGGYVNNKNDHGGETYAGIARKAWPDWSGWKYIDNIKNEMPTAGGRTLGNYFALKPELQNEIVLFYKANFWDKMHLDDLPDQRIANELYDTAVNMGVGKAVMFFQRVLNAFNRNQALFQDITVDGVFGLRTLSAFTMLNKIDWDYIWKALNCLQGAHYISICEADKSQEEFIRGWFKRVFELT